MKTQATAATAAPSNSLVLPLLRRRIMERMASEVFTPAERLRANDTVYNCDDAARLQGWYLNVCRVALEREVAQAAQAPAYATPTQRQQVLHLLNHPTITRREKTALLLPLNRLTVEQAAQALDKLRAAIGARAGDEATYRRTLAGLLDERGVGHTELLAA